MSRTVALLGIVAARVFAGEPPAAPVPPSPWLPLVYRYADALLEERQGRTALFDPERDQNFLRVLYTLSGLSGKPKYREAADRTIARLLADARPEAGALPFGKHRAWLLWDRCFERDPEASRRLTRELARQAAGPGPASPRHAGFFIRAFAAAHRHTGDPAYPAAMATLLEKIVKTGAAGAPPAHRLSLAIDCEAASRLVSEPLASRLRAVAAREDADFAALPHDLKGSGGFAAGLKTGDGPAPSRTLTSLWIAPDGLPTTAQLALGCVARYENTGRVGYRALIGEAADAYLAAEPPADALALTFGHAISLELAAWRSTARPAHLDRARALADRAVKTFWSGGNALPRPDAKPAGGDGPGGAIHGEDTLALALVELHLSILHITAVDCPANTADR